MSHRLAVFGHPVSHSQSPRIHQAFAQQVGLDVNYDKIELPIGGFAAGARAFVDAGGRGFNVTVPFKQDAFNLVDQLTPVAQMAASVNTVSVLADNTLLGANTDGEGLVTDLTVNLGWPLQEQRILVLGAGGAVQGIIGSLLAQAPAALHCWNRTAARADVLAARFGAGVQAKTAAELQSGYDVVINGTSAGLSDRVPALPSRIVGAHSHCYDMVYGGETTRFNNWCQDLGASATADGLGMLVEQAALAFQVWFDVPVNTRPVLEMLRSEL